jgi:hypothetical protein
VSRRLKLNQGSKRRIQQVRWTRREIISAAALLLAMAICSVFFAFWVATHSFH